MTSRDPQDRLNLVISKDKGEFSLKLDGRLDLDASSSAWKEISSALRMFRPKAFHIDAHGITYCDGAGTAVLLNLKKAAARLNVPFNLNGLAEDYQRLLELYPLDKLEDIAGSRPMGARAFVEETGKSTVEFLKAVITHVEFLGELNAAMVKTMFRPASLRFRDLLNVADASGVRALPIITMLGVLVGLIMAFQGAVLMKQFGAEIFIADFVGLSVTRELGPLITAIIVAGRTGSAFAAEIGTMKVNEEIDAFTTMGLDPVRFLVVPRVIAATIMTPLLAVFANLAGIIGGAVVMVSMGFPLITYVNRAQGAVTAVDFVSGLCKAVVFGLLIAGSGCLCGLRTGEGASAVGNSATKAVVTSIVLIVLTDGLFAVLFYYLGI